MLFKQLEIPHNLCNFLFIIFDNMGVSTKNMYRFLAENGEASNTIFR